MPKKELPKEFIDRVRSAYGKEFADIAKEGDLAWLARCMDESSSNCMSIETILRAKSLEALKKKARKEQEKRKLLKELYHLF